MIEYKNGDEVTFKVTIDLSDLIDMGGIDAMNDLANAKHDFKGFMLTDIGYNVIDHEPNKQSGTSFIGGNVVVEVTAILYEM